MGEIDSANIAVQEDAEEISIQEDVEEDLEERYYKYENEDEEVKFSDKFGAPPGPDLGCFGSIVMYFVNKKQKKVRKNHKSLISRNQRIKRGVGRSMKKMKERTVSMLSIASTNWKASKMHLAESMMNLPTRSRHPSKSDFKIETTRSRHVSMQDRLEMYNEEFTSPVPELQPRERKTSKVAFEAPDISQLVVPASHPSVPAPRTRKVSKMSMFEFVPEENSELKKDPNGNVESLH